MNITKMNSISNSTYGVHYDYSRRSEQFYSVSSSWRPGSRPILKIRVARWLPKTNRENSAIIYLEAYNIDEAKELLKKYEDFDFKGVEEAFEAMWLKDNFEDKGHFNTGETDNWWNTKFLPYIRKQIGK